MITFWPVKYIYTVRTLALKICNDGDDEREKKTNTKNNKNGKWGRGMILLIFQDTLPVLPQL